MARLISIPPRRSTALRPHLIFRSAGPLPEKHLATCENNPFLNSLEYAWIPNQAADSRAGGIMGRTGSELRRSMRGVLLASVAAGCLLCAGLSGVRADGGAGGSPGGGAGGVDSLTGAGGAGANGTGTGAGGGGGAGVTGGAGGSGAVGGSGGAGGASAGANGANGSFGTGAGAGAGGGGAHGYVGATAPTSSVFGGNGGYGGSDGGSNGGGGGAGGYGAVISGSSLVINQTLFGGTGGNGGYGNWGGTGYGGNGGTGGAGLALTGTGGVSATISSQITGGNGGQAGTGSPGGGEGGVNGVNGAGGAGITGAGLSLVLTSTAVVTGGLGGDGVTRAAAIAFTGGTNVLELQPGATLTGAVTGAGAGDILRLGGASGTASLDLGQLNSSGQLAGFGLLIKTGASTWTLTGSTTATPDVSVNAGVLALGSGTTLASNMVVASAGTLQLSGQNTLSGTLLLEGTLAAQGSGNGLSGTLTLAGGAALDVATGGSLTLAGGLTGSGPLNKTGGGLLTLSNTAGYSGGINVSAGALALGSGQSLTGATTIASGASLLLQGGTTLSGATSLAGTLSAQAGSSTLSGGLSLAGTGIVDVAGGASLAVASSVSGSGLLVKAGAGTLNLSGTNTHTGGTEITAGTLVLTSGGTLPGAVGIGAGGTLSLSGGSTLAGTVTLAGMLATQGANSLTGALVLNGTATLATATGSVVQVNAGVSGGGSLLKTGEGTLVLSQAASYAGQTNIAAGTLALTGAGGLPATVLTLAQGATFDASASTAPVTLAGLSGGGLVALGANTLTLSGGTAGFHGTLTGTGGLTIAGADQALAGTFTYSGTTRVANGTLNLNGTLTQSGVTVGAGGVFSGNATVQSLTVEAGGRVSPGNSPGTISSATTVTLQPGATYVADITASGSHDLIAAGGAASVGGANLQVVTAPGVYWPGSSYVLLTAAGGVTGQFASVTSNSRSYFLDLATEVSGDSMTVTFVRNGNALRAVAASGNGLAIARELEAMGLGSLLPVLIFQLSAPEARLAFEALSGEVYASSASVAQQQSAYVRDAVGARLRQSITPAGAAPLGYGPAATAPLAPGLTPALWAQGYGGWGSTSGNGNAASVSNSIGGFLMGADVAVAENARAGLFAGFGQGQFAVDARSSNGAMQTYDVGAYAGAQFGPWALRGGAAYAWNDMSVTRSIVFPNLSASAAAGYTTGTAQVFGELGYDFSLGAIAFEPFAGLAYVNVGGASFSESGSIAALAVETAAMETLYSTLGVRAATAFGFMGRTLTPSLTVGWQHAFGDTVPVSSVTFAGAPMPASISGAPIATDALLLEAGLSGALSATATLAVNYTGQLASGASQNALTAQFSLRF